MEKSASSDKARESWGKQGFVRVHSVLKNPRNVNSARKFPSSLPQRLFAPQRPHQCSFWLTKPTSTYLQAKVLGEENDWEVDAVEVKHNLQPVKLCNVLICVV